MKDPLGNVQTNGRVTNITHRKGAEEAVHESEERYRLMVEDLIDLVAEVSLDLRFLYKSQF
jgi:PAS domain-containing protein